MQDNAGGATPPGPRGLPIVGSLFDFTRDTFGFVTRAAREYGPVAHYTVLGEDFYQLNDPDLIEQVLVHQNEKFVKGHVFQQHLGPVLGEGLLNAEGEQWRRQRHLINPAFHPDRIQEYAGIMTGETADLLDGWTDGETVNVHDDLMATTLEIVATALMGADVSHRTGEVGRALDVIMRESENVLGRVLPTSLPTPGQREFERAKRTLDDVVADIVAEKREAPGDDVVSMLLQATDEAGEGMSDEQVRDEVTTLLLAGHETTALALTFTAFLLAQHPEVEARLVAELDEVLDGEPPTAADAADLAFTERVVQESMRLYPPVHSIVREPVVDVELGDYLIPAGTTVAMRQWTVHRDPRFWEDPMAFRPDRWAEAAPDRPRFAYFPFAGGPRRCIGDRFAMLEAKLVLATLYQRVHLELVSEPALDLAASITTRPKSELRMRVHER